MLHVIEYFAKSFGHKSHCNYVTVSYRYINVTFSANMTLKSGSEVIGDGTIRKLVTNSYSHCVATVAVSLAVF